MTVHATWNRKLPGFDVLGFADHSYLINIGSDRKIPLITIGWYRWHPNSIEFPRWGLGPWPRDERDET
jgi:hypothetical protein